jgi:hypothetical protein
MAAADKNTRRSDEAERARHIAAGEAAAFATTAGTMLLGLVTEAEAAQHRNEPSPQTPPAPPSSPTTEAAPTEGAPADHGPQREDQHAGAFERPATDSAPMIHAGGAVAIQSPDPAAGFDAAPAAEAIAPHVSPLSIPVWNFDAVADHAPTAGESAGLGGITTPPSFDLGASIDQLADTITGLIDTSLATVSQTIASLSTTVGQLTSSLSGTIGHVTDGPTDTVSSISHEAPVAATVEPPVTDLLGLTPTATDSSGASPHGASLLDSAGTVPTALFQPPPLQLGFLGQPTIDGHETHDGAFSALGVHHF